MASYTTRIELVNADSDDYELLHQEMRDREFYRAIDYCGVWHDLPTAEYDRTSNALLGQIYSDAGAAAQAVINHKPLNDQQEKKRLLSVGYRSGRQGLHIAPYYRCGEITPGSKSLKFRLDYRADCEVFPSPYTIF